MEVLTFCHQSGSLGKFQRRGLITLASKKVDRLDPRAIGDPLPCSLSTMKLPLVRSTAVYVKLFISLWPMIRRVGCRVGLLEIVSLC